MRIFLRLITISLFIQLTLICTAFSQDIHFNKVLLPDEVSYLISGITQDKEGNIWFSGDGISRYDGVHMKKYTYDRLNSNSIASNFVECIYADKKGFIWAGGIGGGLNKLDPKTGIFTHYKHDVKNPNGISGDTITCILEDKEGMMWIGTETSGLHRMDPATGQFENFSHKDGDPGSLSSNKVRAIYEDKNGELWIGCGGLLYGYQRGKDGGLNRYDRKTGKFISYKHDDKDPHTLIDNSVRAIFEDSRGVFWVGTAGDGLHTMNRQTGSFERHVYDPPHPDDLSRPLRKFFLGIDDYITFITEDVKGFIWIGTFGAGISRYDPATKKMTRYNNRVNADAGFSDSTSYWAFNSRDGIMWISSWNNDVYRIDPSHQNIAHTKLPSGRAVTSVLEEPGRLYLTTDSGLIVWDKKNNQTKLYVRDTKNTESLSDNNVVTIFKDRKSRIWLGTMGSSENAGLFLFNPERQSFKRWHHDPQNSKSLADNTVVKVYEDQQSTLWVATRYGLEKFDVEKNEFTHYMPFPDDSIKHMRNYVVNILEDSQHNLWVATIKKGGLHILNRKTGKFKHYLTRHGVWDVFQDSDGTVWAGTEEGLFSYNAAVDSFTLFNLPYTESGLIYFGINEDRNKNLWLAAVSGIYKLDKDRKISTRFGKSHGYHGSTTYYSGNGFYKGVDERLFMGNVNGFYSFYPEKISSNPNPPEIFITDFQIADQSVIPGPGNAITEDLMAEKNINLKYNQDIFSFYFNIVHYSNPDANRAVYMLENYDKQWRNAGSERTVSLL